MYYNYYHTPLIREKNAVMMELMQSHYLWRIPCGLIQFLLQVFTNVNYYIIKISKT